MVVIQINLYSSSHYLVYNAELTLSFNGTK